ncbi:unnamed protein product [Adineta steineri]|uniref:Uncharacterized protein n=1 Tax=Adineta steineri TaxID=433720 RepID=A0A814T4Y9_9BILA|nr:unnamed protein product [Adineta steineri]
MTPTNNLNQLDPTFMYTQIFKDILLDMEFDTQAVKQFLNYCRNNNCMNPQNINRFEKEYNAQSTIWWYTYSHSISYMLSCALRSVEGDTIINMGFLIRDLHQQIQQLHQQQINSRHNKPFTVYRGQGLSKANFEKLQKTIGGLMSFNNFLFTNVEKDISLEISYSASENADTVGILFVMFIDPRIKSPPFAFIQDVSSFKEEKEILFSMRTVFRVCAIRQMGNNSQLYQVELELTSDDDQQLRLLTNRIREDIGDGTGWQKLGNLLLKIGQFNKAEELYNVLLERTFDESEKAVYYNQLGLISWNQGDCEKAIWYYKQGLEIWQRTLASNHPDLATSYNNIAGVYNNMGEYPKALSSHEKALEIRQETLSSNHLDIATSYNNIGGVYHSMGEYSKALSFYEKSLEIRQKTLPSNHPDLATSYNNIGGMYHNTKEYSKALSFYEKALEIQQNTLPENHLDLATSNNNIGATYNNMGEYSKALLYYERALKIWRVVLSPTHPYIKNLKESFELVRQRIIKHV